MKRAVLSLLVSWAALPALCAGQQASISSAPSPAISNKALEITISTTDLGSSVYCYTWCESVNGAQKSPFTWDGVNNDRFRMSGSGGTYTFRIADIQEFYSLSDTEIEGLTKLGFIAKNANGGQTPDLFITVEQGRRDAYSGGEGTADSPFILSTAEDLAELAATPADWNAGNYFKMQADIDASSLTSPIGSMSRPFGASLDGAGHTISNLSLTGTTFGEPTALFGAIRGGSVSDLGVAGAHISGTAYTAVLAGYLESGTISRCYTSGTVEATSICAGGLVGENAAGEITDCYSGADVSNPTDYATGGLAGKNRGTITRTYAAGKVSGYDYAGGITGANYGSVANSFAINSGINCPNDFTAPAGGNNNSLNRSTANYTWDLMPYASGEWSGFGDHAAETPASQLADRATFARLSGWDFDNIWEWRTETGRQYPVLRGIPNQECMISSRYFSIATSVASTLAEAGEISVGPNPVSSLLHIAAPAPMARIDLFTIGGAHVTNLSADRPLTETSIDMTDNAAGLYLLRVAYADGSIHTFKVIKK